MTYNLTITDEHGRVVAFCKIEEDARFERTHERDRYRDYGRRYDYDFNEPLARGGIIQGGPARNEVSIHMKAIPLKDGSLIKYYKHKPVDKLAGGL